MFRFSLRQLMLMTMGLAIFLALIGIIVNQSRLVQVLFDSGTERVVIESSSLNPRGTFFELFRGERCVIPKTEISQHPIKASEIDTHQLNASGNLMAYHYQNPDPEFMDVLLLVDFRYDAYSVYWAGCRANKCGTFDWQVWDRRSKKFAEKLEKLKR